MIELSLFAASTSYTYLWNTALVFLTAVLISFVAAPLIARINSFELYLQSRLLSFPDVMASIIFSLAIDLSKDDASLDLISINSSQYSSSILNPHLMDIIENFSPKLVSDFACSSPDSSVP
ncbi:hypothetical protein [Candidatus Ichthyocystis hellenicum]|uniref:hypothetical protein n=1 Tax=Candidatus Ichthyocystis hellenicum TaxID=1561003 RepID=UPI000B805945|nr:hypothetical protein [Candidatus Ichthyocystis hellenicum]